MHSLYPLPCFSITIEGSILPSTCLALKYLDTSKSDFITGTLQSDYLPYLKTKQKSYRCLINN